MNLSQLDESKLTFWVSDRVRDATVCDYGCLLDKEPSPPDISEDANRLLEKNLDRGGLIQFVEDEIDRELFKTGVGLSDDEVPLSSIDRYKDSLTVARDIVSKIKSLPRSYLLVVRGPQCLADSVRSRRIDLKISDRLSLVSSSILSERLILTSGNVQYDNHIWERHNIDDRTLGDKYLYFAYYYSGVSCDRFRSKASQLFQDEIRAFYGAALAHGLMYEFSFYSKQLLPVILVRDKDSGEVLNINTMDSDLAACTYFGNRNIKTRYLSNETFEKAVDPVVKMFGCSASSKLKTAALWILRAKLSSRPMDRVLESTIALEVLLGDKDMSDKIGLTKLMANRCAYALGKSTKDRDSLIEFFIEFYRIRSGIVHSGKLESSKKDDDIVSRGLGLASELLVHEQQLSCKL